MIKIVTTIKSGATSIFGCDKQKKKAMEEVSEKIDKIQQDLKVGISDRDKKSEEFNKITRKDIAAIKKKEAEDIDHIKNKIKETQKQLAINKEVSKENKAGTKAVNDKLDEFAREHMGLSGEVNDVRDDVRKLERRLSSLDRDVSDLKGGRENDSSKMGLGKLSDVPIEYDEVTKIEKSVYNQQPVRRLYRTIREIITIAEKEENRMKSLIIEDTKNALDVSITAVKTAHEKVRGLEQVSVTARSEELAFKLAEAQAAASLAAAADASLLVKKAERLLEKIKSKVSAMKDEDEKVKDMAPLLAMAESEKLEKREISLAASVAASAARFIETIRQERVSVAQREEAEAKHQADIAVNESKITKKQYLVKKEVLRRLTGNTVVIDRKQCEKWKKICGNTERVGLGYWGDYPSDVSLKNGLIPKKELEDVNVAIARLGNLNINLNPYDREDSQVVPIENAHGRLLYNIIDIVGIMKVDKMSERYERRDSYKKSGGINDHLVNIIREYINPDKN